MQVKRINQLFEVKDISKSKRTIVQAYTRYNIVDSDGDIARRGMFSKTWRENFNRIKHLLNHDHNRPLGKIEKLWDDEEYAYVESKIGSHSLGDDFIQMAESGLITEASYGFETIKKNRTNTGNELLEVRLWEVSSLTAWGANQYTPIISIEKANERIGLLEKFNRNSRVSEYTSQLLELELKGLKRFVSSGSENIPDYQIRYISDLLDKAKRDIERAFK